MTHQRAIITIDHHQAVIISLADESHTVKNVRLHSHETPQHGAAVRDQHEFYAEVADSLKGLSALLIAGHRTGLDDFKHYVDKHRPALAELIIGYETIDSPTEGQLVALARDAFEKHERLAHS